MKKFLMLSMVLMSFVSYGQTTKVFKLIYEKDKMEDEEYLQSNWNLLALKTPKTGFWIRMNFIKNVGEYIGYIDKNGDINERYVDGNKTWKYDGLTVMASGIGTCHEKDYLIFLFDDGTKVRTDMWNKFNCSGDIYLDWDKKLENDLRTKPIKIIRLTNGRSFESYEKEYTKLEDKNYFITYFKKLDEFNKKIK